MPLPPKYCKKHLRLLTLPVIYMRAVKFHFGATRQGVFHWNWSKTWRPYISIRRHPPPPDGVSHFRITFFCLFWIEPLFGSPMVFGVMCGEGGGGQKRVASKHRPGFSQFRKLWMSIIVEQLRFRNIVANIISLHCWHFRSTLLQYTQ